MSEDCLIFSHSGSMCDRTNSMEHPKYRRSNTHEGLCIQRYCDKLKRAAKNRHHSGFARQGSRWRVFFPGLDTMAITAERLQIFRIVPGSATPQWYDVVDLERSITAATPAAVFIPIENRKTCAPPLLGVELSMVPAHAKEGLGKSLKPGGNVPVCRSWTPRRSPKC